MIDRRQILTGIAALAGTGAVAKAVEQKPDEPKVLFYVLTLGDEYEDVPDVAIENIKRKFAQVTGLRTPLLVMSRGMTLQKCTELAEISTANPE